MKNWALVAVLVVACSKAAPAPSEAGTPPSTIASATSPASSSLHASGVPPSVDAAPDSAPDPGLVQSIVQGVLKKDYTVQLLAKRAGGATVHELEGLLHHSDPQVRMLAVYCLGATGDASAGKGLAQAVLDPNVQVAMAAAKALHGVASPSLVPGLLAAFDHAAEPIVRREVALVLGPLAGLEDLAAMKQRWKTESVADAKEGLTVALAGRGDDEARREFDKRLLASRGDVRLRWLENAELVAEPWLLPALTKILSDKTKVLRVGVDARPDLIDSLRACDLSLILIAKITGAKFSFPVTRDHNYTDAELQEALRLANASTP